MSTPSFEWLEDGSTPITGVEIDNAHPIEFGECRKGNTVYPQTVVQRTINLWNDRNGVSGSDTATGITITVVALDNDPDHVAFVGTDLNGGGSCFQARSVGSFNCSADSQTDWTTISPSEGLSIGDMPSNSMRAIQVRVVVPVDIDAFAEDAFELRVNY